MEEDIREQVLNELGFSKNEAKVYLALLELGSSTATKIAEKSKIHRTNVYDALEGLLKKGVIAYILKGEVKYFRATDPKNLLNVVKEKEARLQSILPQFDLSHKLAKNKDKAYIFEEINGIKAITDDILAEGKDVYTFGIPRDVSVKMKSFISIYHKRRAKAKMWQYHIYNENAQDRIKQLNSMPYTKAAFLPKEYDSPATTTVYADKVSFFIWSEPPLGILIESSRMAKSYRNYFRLLWKIATGEELKI